MSLLDDKLGYSRYLEMAKRTKAEDLPEFDTPQYLDCETSIAAYPTDILEANDAGLLA